MALKKFVGARYAPSFAGAWNQATQYPALSVVYSEQRSYVSRKTVPAGTAITNQEFWIQSSDWNAQVAEYNQKVDGYSVNVEKYNKNVEDYQEAVNGFYADTLHSFDTKAAMQADKTLKLGETLLTCGNKVIGDGGGSFYQVVSETSVDAVALDNGLFAKPFEFQPYDYSQFQTEVEGYKKSTTRVYQNTKAMIADTSTGIGDTLMTSGANTAGDGKGRFWYVTDNITGDGYRLGSGKYATPLMLASDDTANMLYFNSKGAKPAIYGIKEGSAAVNIPMILNEGDIKTVYVAVEYTIGGRGAIVNLEIGGSQNFTKTFSFNDSAPSSGTYKTVLYAITGKSEGGNVYAGFTTVTSYNTALELYNDTITVGVPDSSNTTWNTALGSDITAEFNVTKAIKLKSFTAKTTTMIIPGSDTRIVFSVYKSNDSGTSDALYTETVDIATTIDKTFNCDIELNPGNKYAITVNATATVGFTSLFYTPAAISGTYGPFNFTSGNYSGILTYTNI